MPHFCANTNNCAVSNAFNGVTKVYACCMQGGCTDCYNARRRMRARQPRLTGLSTGICSAVAGGLVDAGGDVNDGEDDVLHKVHVMLHTRMDTIRVQVQTQQTNVFVIVFSQSGMGIRGEFFLQRIV